MAKKMKIEITEKWCKGCGLCLNVCPKKVLELNDHGKCVPMRQDDCIGCRQCENVCPDFAVTVKEREE